MKSATTEAKKPAAAKKTPSPSITQLLHADHQKVRDLFFTFSQTEESKEKAELVKEILKELYIHATVEEEIVYPAVRNGADDVEDMMTKPIPNITWSNC